MGNCLVLEEKVIRVMKTDGKILEYQSPIKVQQVLSDFSCHAVSNSFSDSRTHLHPDAKLMPGMLYYLVPLPTSPSQNSAKKKVRFSNMAPDQESNDDQQGSDGVVRIKLIISKKELLELVQKGVSGHDMVSRMQSNQRSTGDDDDDNCRKWKPALESIAEVN